MKKHTFSHDRQLAKLIDAESQRQNHTINLIASENYAPQPVLAALGSVFTNKYSEGYPGKRYYPGNELADQLETLAITRARQLFGAEHVNVQALSGGPANLAIYSALLKPGDTILAMQLSHGGHLSHGQAVNLSGRLYQVVFYGVDPATGRIDLKAVAQLAKQHRPKLIIAGFSAYAREIDWAGFSRIAKQSKAYLLADISHTAGLIAAGLMASPVGQADVVMTTTHKSLRGPRGAIIMCRAALGAAIDKAIFPGFQGGPHMNTIAGIAAALKLCQGRDFKKYAKLCIANAQAMADEFSRLGLKVISGGTDNHLLVLDLASLDLSGREAEELLAGLGITSSRSTIPDDPKPPYNPSGLRLGSPAMTTRGCQPKDFRQLARWIFQALSHPQDRSQLRQLKQHISQLARQHPIT